MEGKMTGLDVALQFINDYAPNGLTPFARQKTTVFYDLAHVAAPGGAIVELGSYLGFGTVPLCYGAQDGNGNDVFAVDAYAPMNGWIGEPYGPSNEEEFWRNTALADVHPFLVKEDVLDAERKCDYPVSLLVHDLGSLNRMPKDVVAWERHVVIGGTIAVRDIDDYRMGTEEAVGRLIATGRWGLRKNWPAFVTSVERIA
jgi:hypothetical protein